MSIINFLLRLHAVNLARRIREHKRANPQVNADDLAKHNAREIEESRRRMNDMLKPAKTTSPFDGYDS